MWPGRRRKESGGHMRIPRNRIQGGSNDNNVIDAVVLSAPGFSSRQQRRAENLQRRHGSMLRQADRFWRARPDRVR